MSQSASELDLGMPGYTFSDLHEPGRLAALDQQFRRELSAADANLATRFEAYRNAGGEVPGPVELSELLVEMGPYVGRFLARLFDIENPHHGQTQALAVEFDEIFTFRREVVQTAVKRYKSEDSATWDRATIAATVVALAERGSDQPDPERRLAALACMLSAATGPDAETSASRRAIGSLKLRLNANGGPDDPLSALLGLSDEDFAVSGLDLIQRWCLLAQQDSGLAREVRHWVSFKTPARTVFSDLVPHATNEHNGYSAWEGMPAHRRRRDGFHLTDERFGERETLYEVDHCIYCHDRDTDSCSKGMRNKRGGGYKVNPLGITVTGCPLAEKISEMQVLKRQGDNIGALALIMIDNPLCPGTGHRICNDCMKGCIYQKTEPVNIPQIETNVLTDVLDLPWGFEIYDLLTRWNPLNAVRPVALPYNGKNVLIVGLGPAGYTLAHYLTNEGFAVVGVDALKLEPLPEAWTGTDTIPPDPIRDFATIHEDLSTRTLTGFGGVAEYGITVRWDKNFLRMIYLSLVRRRNFASHGGIRFGGTLTIDDAWDRGFDHIALATGAGKPTIIGMDNNLIRGVRKASDFLMALQLTGAAKDSSLANLQIRLPAGVIGGGLTAIDTATEVMAYYPVQVEKTRRRYQLLCAWMGKDTVRTLYDAEELGILDEFLAHGEAIAGERQRAEAAGEAPDFAPLIRRWGGVTLFYRKGIKDSPAYRQNHEEIAKALEEGIELAEGMSPLGAIRDPHTALAAVRFDRLSEEAGKWHTSGDAITLPMRSLFVAAGTSPNTIYEQEYPGTFVMDGKFFQRYNRGADGQISAPAEESKLEPKIANPAPFTSYENGGRRISFYGDNHPVYAGNVVKAMASARDGYPHVVALFSAQIAGQMTEEQSERDGRRAALFAGLDEDLRATVIEVNRLTPTIVEVIVRAPMQARRFKPGQFYRVQNFEATAPVIDQTVLAAEGLALTGAWVDQERGLVSLITLEMGSSSRLCAYWRPGDRLVLMGVTGTPTGISEAKTVMLVGGGLGNAVQFSIGKALRATGNRVVYFAGYKRESDVFKVEEIEAAADVIVWAVDPGEQVAPISPTRPQDKTFVGNIIEAMIAYGSGSLGEAEIALSDVDHMIVIGSDRMMAAVKQARHQVLAPYLKPLHTAIGSINSPMQCMMKGICAQCLCKHVDPATGEPYFVYSCFNQDQELDHVDFDNLNARLRQNSVQEKLSNLWLDYLLAHQAPEHPANASKESQTGPAVQPPFERS